MGNSWVQTAWCLWSEVRCGPQLGYRRPGVCGVRCIWPYSYYRLLLLIVVICVVNRCVRICCQNSKVLNDLRRQRSCEPCASLAKRYDHGHISGLSVLSMTALASGEWWNLTLSCVKTPNFVYRLNCVMDTCRHTIFYPNPFVVSFPHMREITYPHLVGFFLTFLSSLQLRWLHGFHHATSQKTHFCTKVCLLGL